MRLLIIFIFIINLFANEINDTNMTEDMIYPVDLPQLVEENITDNVMSDDEYQMNIAIILNKDTFFQFIPNILNSANAYLIKKNINYKIKLFDKEGNLTSELNKITQEYKYIFLYSTNSKELEGLGEKYPNNYFFIPTLNKSQINFPIYENVFFGGINYEKQINKLNRFVSGYTMVIYEKNDLSKYITTIINGTLLEPHKSRKYPIRYNKGYNDVFVYLNTKVVDTAQILSNFTYNKISPKLILSTQINYSPLIFSLTNPDDVSNLLIANSIFNIPPMIKDNNLNLGSNINFNWLNYTTSTLLNVAYNLETEENISFLNDFNLYMFFNQINYKTNLYKISRNGFIKIEN